MLLLSFCDARILHPQRPDSPVHRKKSPDAAVPDLRRRDREAAKSLYVKTLTFALAKVKDMLTKSTEQLRRPLTDVTQKCTHAGFHLGSINNLFLWGG